jgi:hypothetical protein
LIKEELKFGKMHTQNQEIFENINNKVRYLSKVEEDTNIYLSHLMPNNEHSWKLTDVYRHQGVKKREAIMEF